MKPYTQAIALYVLAMSGAKVSSAAHLLLGNLPADNDRFGATASAAESVQHAISFVMPPREYPVHHISLVLQDYNTQQGDIAQVGLYRDEGDDLPGALVGGLFLNPPSLSNDSAEFKFSPSTSIKLGASLKYWLVVGAASGIFSWEGAVPASPPISDVGATFGKFVGLISGEPRPSIGIASFEIVVPEPQSLFVVAIALACLTIERRPHHLRRYMKLNHMA